MVRLFILAIALASLMSSVMLMPVRPARAQAIGGTWAVTGNLNVPRAGGQTATLLSNGKVLTVGGVNLSRSGYATLNSAELYDPVTGAWSLTGNLNYPRQGHSATLLRNGQVLVVGGSIYHELEWENLSSAEIFDPDKGEWRSTASLKTITGHLYATLLGDGRVMAVGTSSHGVSNPAYSAELYDPFSGTWTSTSAPLSFSGNSYRGSLTLLPNGKVLVLDGETGSELYDPAAGTWSKTGSFNTIQEVSTASLLHNGKMLVTGWIGSSPSSPPAAELYDPNTATWSVTGIPPITGRATLLSDGRVLLTGDYDAYVAPAPGSGDEVYDPNTGTWSQTSLHIPPRSEYTTTLLSDGRVLAAGGADADFDNGEIIFSNAELYTPAVPIINQIDDTQFFVRQHYRDFLNREPDAEGLAFWTNEIASCGGDTRCIEVKRINDSASFFLSIEFQQTGYLVYRMHKASYGNLPNAPAPLRLNEFLPDTKEIGQGVVVNQSGWEQALENNKQAFMSEFVQRDRFTSSFPATMSADQFVDALNQNAGNPLSQTERDSLVSDFSSGVKTRADVLRAIAENQNLVDAEFNRAFVLMQYFGYLRRDPNQGPDTDYSGYNFWLNKLDAFNGNFIDAEMVKAFIESAEYRQRFVK